MKEEIPASVIDQVVSYVTASPIGPAVEHFTRVALVPALAAAEAQFGKEFYVEWGKWLLEHQAAIMQGLMMVFMLVIRTFIARKSNRAEANRAMLVRQAKEDKVAADKLAAAAPKASTPASPAATITPAAPVVEVAATKAKKRVAKK